MVVPVGGSGRSWWCRGGAAESVPAPSTPGAAVSAGAAARKEPLRLCQGRPPQRPPSPRAGGAASPRCRLASPVPAVPRRAAPSRAVPRGLAGQPSPLPPPFYGCLPPILSPQPGEQPRKLACARPCRRWSGRRPPPQPARRPQEGGDRAGTPPGAGATPRSAPLGCHGAPATAYLGGGPWRGRQAQPRLPEGAPRLPPGKRRGCGAGGAGEAAPLPSGVSAAGSPPSGAGELFGFWGGAPLTLRCPSVFIPHGVRGASGRGMGEPPSPLPPQRSRGGRGTEGSLLWASTPPRKGSLPHTRLNL